LPKSCKADSKLFKPVKANGRLPIFE